MQAMLGRIKTEPLPKAILVHGPETALQDQIFRALKERIAGGPMAEWNWSVLQGGKEFEPDSLLIELGTVPWGGGGGRKWWYCSRPIWCPPRLWTLLPLGCRSIPGPIVWQFFLASLDNRLKYVRKLREFAWIIECERLQGEKLIRYLLDYCALQGKKNASFSCETFSGTGGYRSYVCAE